MEDADVIYACSSIDDSIYSLLDVFPHSVILAASELKVECDFEHRGEEGRSFVAVAIALVSDLRRVHWLNCYVTKCPRLHRKCDSAIDKKHLHS